MTDRNEKGQYLTPPDNANVFDTVSGRGAALARWDKDRRDLKTAMIRFAANRMDKEPSEVTYEDALDYIVNDPQFQASQEGKTAAAKFIATRLGIGGGEPVQTIDNRQVTINYLYQTFLTDEDMARYLTQLQEDGLDEPTLAFIAAQVTGEAPYDIKIPLD